MASIDPRNLGPALEKTVAKFGARSNKRMAQRNAADAPGAPLFHYTNQLAFENIVTTEEFWFFSIYHMDDTEELNFGFDVCRSILQSTLDRLEAREPADRVLQLFVEPLIEPTFRDEIRAIVEFYSVSFGARDDAKQWDRYGNTGQGVAIGLSPEFFIPLPIENPKPEECIYFGKVAYGERNAKTRHSRIIQSVTDLITQQFRAGRISGGEIAQAVFRRLLAETYCEVLWNCVTTKSDDWKNQNEGRLLVLNRTGEPKLLVYTNSGRPYVKIPQPTLRKFLDEVMVGPKAERTAEAKVRVFLDKLGLRSVRVTRSSCSTEQSQL
jgi:hypothetical protein